jgi:aminoglycoside phosphotransferase (APT) family kinase protein
LHAVQWQGTDLEGIGRPQGYLERQLKRWTKQCELTLPYTRSLPGLKEVGDWLQQRLPPDSAATVVHGDYKVDNVMFSAQTPARLVAIFDWEMATLGDPLTDLGWLLSFWGPTGDAQGEKDEAGPIGSNYITQQAGFLSREEMAARYEQQTGRSMEHFPFYHCLAVWKYAVILEGLYRLYLEGSAANPKTAEFEWKVPQLVKRAQRIMAEAG